MIWNLTQVTGLSIEDILYKWSFENVLLFSRSTPSYDLDKESKKDDEWDASLDANDPNNFND